MDGFFLGISSGLFCLSSCAPVIVPFLLGEGKKVSGNFFIIGLFLTGRLLGYILFAISAWYIGNTILSSHHLKNIFLGGSDIILSVILLFYALFEPKDDCKLNTVMSFFGGKYNNHYLPILLGFITGINICPPFLLALIQSINKGSILNCLLFFILFFIGTSVYITLTAFIGLLSSVSKLRIIGKLTAIVISFYYLYSGSLIILRETVRI